MSKTHSFVALYVGGSIATARLIAASADEEIVRWVAEQLLDREDKAIEDDVHAQAVQQGRRKALSHILKDRGQL